MNFVMPDYSHPIDILNELLGTRAKVEQVASIKPGRLHKYVDRQNMKRGRLPKFAEKTRYTWENSDGSNLEWQTNADGGWLAGQLSLPLDDKFYMKASDRTWKGGDFEGQNRD